MYICKYGRKQIHPSIVSYQQNSSNEFILLQTQLTTNSSHTNSSQRIHPNPIHPNMNSAYYRFIPARFIPTNSS